MYVPHCRKDLWMMMMMMIFPVGRSVLAVEDQRNVLINKSINKQA